MPLSFSSGTAKSFGFAGGIYPDFPPDPPIIGTAANAGPNAITITFTAPVNKGSSGITTYTATSSPGGITGSVNQSDSGTITVNGLTTGQSYTFRVTATNNAGTSYSSSASNSAIPGIITGQAIYTIDSPNPTGGVGVGPVTFRWVCPAGVTSISVICVGAGGRSFGTSYMAGGGAALAYINNYAVTPGQTYNLGVANNAGTSAARRTSYFGSALCEAEGGYDSFSSSSTNYAGAVKYGTGARGGPGGRGSGTINGGGGGAGGYSGQNVTGGGTGGSNSSPTGVSSGTAGGGGGGNAGQNGGGVGIFGQGASGSANGTPGSGGSGTTYGGGAGAQYTAAAGTIKLGGPGVVRIVWPGSTRRFPTTSVGNF